MNSCIESFYDDVTGTITYVVYDRVGGHAAIIDPVLDFNPRSAHTSTASIDAVLAYVKKNTLTVDWILETHAHADHLSAASFVKTQVGGKIAIGQKISRVQQVFKKVFNLEADFAVDGSQFDHLFQDQEIFQVGALTAKAIAVAGHTPADMAYQFDDAIFVGDTLFMPDVGTARCDFPQGSASTLYQSIQKILSYPAHTKLYMCHDYPPATREPHWISTVEEQRKNNIHVHDGVTEADFVAMRNARDATLDMPNLIIPSIQVNIRAGHLPTAEDNGTQYLKIPLNTL
jgi:glyoxylase-like metal-dependent hydrolase (beta-lactamase superfamily II)